MVACRVLLCDCAGTLPLAGLGNPDPADAGCHELCRADIGLFRAALTAATPLVVACRQEMSLFEEIRAEVAADSPVAYVDIRDRAGWSDEAVAARPKIIALLAEAACAIPAVAAVGLRSAGAVLILGRDETALAAARQLALRMPVRLVLCDAADVIPGSRDDVPMFHAEVRAAEGFLGAFAVTVGNLAARHPAGRGRLRFGAPVPETVLEADILLDLTGGAPLFPDFRRRDGYLRPDPRDPAAVQKALLDATALVGDFEKPRFIATQPALCAHSRNAKPGCRRCLDVCPTGAVRADGDAVAVQPQICGGCGSCAAACPTGALACQAPPAALLEIRLETLLRTFQSAGGRDPVLLVHEEDGYEILAAAARYDRGLPARVLPFAVNEVTRIDLGFLVMALALGAGQIVLLLPRCKRDETTGLCQQMAMLEALVTGLGYGEDRVVLQETANPDVLLQALYSLPLRPLPFPPLATRPRSLPEGLPTGDHRHGLRVALAHLHAGAAALPAGGAPAILALPAGAPAILALPAGAPFGTVLLKEDACTLCMACTEVCPTAALRATPDRPQLDFVESACIQCGLCRSTCPEAALTLVPRLAFAADAPRRLKAGEPALCARCQKPFGVAAVVDRMVAVLADRHPMFMGEAAQRLRLCEDCRIIAQFEAETPLPGTRPRRPRTTEDDLRERREAQAQAQAQDEAQARKEE